MSLLKNLSTRGNEPLRLQEKPVEQGSMCPDVSFRTQQEAKDTDEQDEGRPTHKRR